MSAIFDQNYNVHMNPSTKLAFSSNNLCALRCISNIL